MRQPLNSSRFPKLERRGQAKFRRAIYIWKYNMQTIINTWWKKVCFLQIFQRQLGKKSFSDLSTQLLWH